MWFLEMIESALLAVPWALVVFIVAIVAIYALAIVSWITLVVWVDVLGRDVSWNLEPAGGWDPDEFEQLEEAAHGRSA